MPLFFWEHLAAVKLFKSTVVSHSSVKATFQNLQWMPDSTESYSIFSYVDLYMEKCSVCEAQYRLITNKTIIAIIYCNKSECAIFTKIFYCTYTFHLKEAPYGFLERSMWNVSITSNVLWDIIKYYKNFWTQHRVSYDSWSDNWDG